MEMAKLVVTNLHQCIFSWPRLKAALACKMNSRHHAFDGRVSSRNEKIICQNVRSACASDRLTTVSTVSREIPCSRAKALTLAFFSYASIIALRCSGVVLEALPSTFPSAFARANPAYARLTIRSRSISATAAKMVSDSAHPSRSSLDTTTVSHVRNFSSRTPNYLRWAARALPLTVSVTSVALRASSRIKAFELDAGIFSGELPVDFGLKVVTADRPGSNLAAHGFDAVDAPVQALADHDVDFNLGHVQPAAVLGCIDKLETVSQRLGLFRGKRLVQRALGERVQVVHHQRDAFGVRIA